ncbi:hypothetical protein FB645_001513 [Coemansia sp. IMI 203386]|nr:hypothetical protein FB645_001513 [Coemansia sp. IMI 203386]
MACSCNCASNDASVIKSTAEKAVQTEKVEAEAVVETKETAVQTEAVVETAQAEKASTEQSANTPDQMVRVYVILRTNGIRCLGYVDMLGKSKVSDIKPIVVKDLQHVRSYKLKTLSGNSVDESATLQSYVGMESIEVTILNKPSFFNRVIKKRLFCV